MTCATRRGKNTAMLESFAAYCIRNPDLRFWQALRNWSGYNFILAVGRIGDKKPLQFDDQITITDHDTFSWEGRDG